jgi:cytochrome P450
MRATAHINESMQVAAELVPGNRFLGNLLDFRRDRIAFSHRVARDHGDIAESRMGFVRLLLVSSPALAHEVLVEKNESFVKSAGLSIFARPLLGNGLLTSERDVHKRQRRMMAPIFAHKRIAGYADVMRDRAIVSARRLVDAKETDVCDEMMRLTLEIVGKTLFDAELGTNADDVGEALTRAMRQMMNGLVRLVPTPPIIPTPGNLRFRHAVRRLDDIVYRLIAERRASAADRGDLLGILLATRHEDDGSALSDTELRDQSMTLMLAGHETTANALAWTLYLLARNPAARERVEREADEVLHGRNITAADLPSLPLALQAIKESMRLYPPAYVIGRQASRPTEIGGVSVRKGRVVLVNVAGIHRRPDVFPSPERFDLDRLTAAAEKKLPPLAYMPFGAGPRVCIGNHFALMEAHVVLVTLLQRLRIDLLSQEEIGTEPLVTLRPKGGLPGRITARKPSVGDGQRLQDATP